MSNQPKDILSPLISGLPDDIALSCLARVPLMYHTVLKCVSRRWRDLIRSEEWHLYRQKHNLAEPLIFALCWEEDCNQLKCYRLDPNAPRRSWKLIPRVPPEALRRKGVGLQTLGKKVYLLGGCMWSQEATTEVYCYDAPMNSWIEAAPLATARCYFACEVVDNKLYAVGGIGSRCDARSWDVYDPQTRSWMAHWNPNIDSDIGESVVMEGKIYITRGFSYPPYVHVFVFDPSSGTWQDADANMASGWVGPAVVIDETLYVLDQISGTRLMMWRKETKEWVLVGRLSALRTRPPCRLVAVGKNIFVIGKGLSTVVFDVSLVGVVAGVIVGSSIIKTSNEDVLSCKSLFL